MKIFLCLTLCLLGFFGRSVLALEREANNSVFVEGLGAGFFYSLNYERIVFDDFGLRVGAEYAPLQSTWSAFERYAFSFPLTLNYLGVSSGSHALELGAGMSLSYSKGESLLATKPGFEIFGIGVAGYRFQSVKGGFQLRAGLTTLFGNDVSYKFESDKRNILVWPHLSLGWAF